MLYDNAELASVYLAAFEVTQDRRWRDVAEETFAFIERQMTAPEGGFYAAFDAETKGQVSPGAEVQYLDAMGKRRITRT